MQIIIILEIFKDFFPCKIVLSANHHYPENIQRLFRLQFCLIRKSSLSWKYSKKFFLQNCLSRKSSLSLKYSKTFFLQNCLRCKSSLSWKYSKTFSPARLSWAQIIIILKTFKDFFACNFVLSANHHYPESIQRIFSCKIVLAVNHLYPENIQRLFSCKIVLDANHHYPGNIQRLSPLQNCLERKSPLYWKHSKIFSPAILSYPQIIIILKVFKEFFPAKLS